MIGKENKDLLTPMIGQRERAAFDFVRLEFLAAGTVGEIVDRARHGQQGKMICILDDRHDHPSWPSEVAMPILIAL